MITTLFFPLRTTLLTYLTQIFVTCQRWLFAVPMLPDFGMTPWRNVDLRVWRKRLQGGIDRASIITSIRRHTGQRLITLLQQLLRRRDWEDETLRESSRHFGSPVHYTRTERLAVVDLGKTIVGELYLRSTLSAIRAAPNCYRTRANF